MLQARDSNGSFIDPSPNRLGVCPLCDAAVRSKCGDIKVWHFAHVAGDDCDRWAEPETEWHRSWKLHAPPERREVPMIGHRADVVASDGRVVELQHSSISTGEIREREAAYGRMIWLFDVRECVLSERLTFRPRRDVIDPSLPWLVGSSPAAVADPYRTFRWKQARKSIAWAKTSVLLDIGDEHELFWLQRMFPEAPTGGWGRRVRRERFIDFLGGASIPPESPPRGLSRSAGTP